MTSKEKSLGPVAWAAVSFTLLASAAIALAVFGIVSFQMGLLMLVGLVGLHLGVGVLVLIYRFVGRLK